MIPFNKRIVSLTKSGYHWRKLILILITLSLVACTSEESNAFSGTWESERWGILEIEQNGSKVVGSYEYASADGRIYGQLEGEVDRNRLDLKWWEDTAPGVSYTDAAARGEAYLILRKADDRIVGEWRGEGQEEWTGTWQLVKR